MISLFASPRTCGFAELGRRLAVRDLRGAMMVSDSCQLRYCFVFELRGGLICRVREYMDTARGHRDVFGTQALGGKREADVPATNVRV
jgi:hypothetical protein